MRTRPRPTQCVPEVGQCAKAAMAGAHATTINPRPTSSQPLPCINLVPYCNPLCIKPRRVLFTRAIAQTATIEVSCSESENAMNLGQDEPAHQQQQQQSLAWQQRTRLLLGDEKASRLHHARVLVVGLGGVGSFAAEFLARAGVGSLTIVDGDTVDLSNCNRQLPAMSSTIGMSKVQVMQDRLCSIAPSAIITGKQEFLLPESAHLLLAAGCLGQDGRYAPFDWVVDAIDSLEPKKLLIANAQSLGIPVISAMGAGGRLDASKVRVVPLSATYNDPFATNVRRGLRKKGIDISKVPCVWSDEPVTPNSLQLTTGGKFKRSYHGTISFLPAQFGLLAAAHVINAITDGPMARAYQTLHKQQAAQKRGRRPARKTAAPDDKLQQRHDQAAANTTIAVENSISSNGFELAPVFFSYEMLQQEQRPTMSSSNSIQLKAHRHVPDEGHLTSSQSSNAVQQCTDTVEPQIHSDHRYMSYSNIDDREVQPASTDCRIHSLHTLDNTHTLDSTSTHVMPSYTAALHSDTSFCDEGWGI